MQSALRPRLRVFSEVRLHQGYDGTVFLRDQADAAVWDSYLGEIDHVSVAARLGPPDASASVAIEGVEVHGLPYYEGPRALVRRLLRVVVAIDDAVQAPHLCLFRLPGAQSLLGSLMARARRRPYVVEIVGDPVAVLRSGVAGRTGRVLAPLAHLVMRWVVTGAQAVRYETRSTLQALYPPRRGAATFSYSTVDLDADDFVDEPRQADRPLSTVLTIGTQDQLYKGHDDLIAATAQLAAQGLAIMVIIVGDGRHHERLRDMARDLGVASQIRFVGRVNSRTVIRELFSEADLFCMPSRTEGLPRALIEAMAQGLPAVATRVGGIPELLAPSALVSPDDPVGLAQRIRWFIEHTEVRASLAAGNLDRARTYGRDQQEVSRRGWRRCIAMLAAMPQPDQL